MPLTGLFLAPIEPMEFRSVQLFFISLLSLVLFGSQAWAQAEGELRTKVPDTKSEDTFLQAHNSISSSIRNLSNGIDSYFGNTQAMNYKNDTNFRVYNISISREGQAVNNVTNFQLRFRLPNLEKKFQFNFDHTNDAEEGLNTRAEDGRLARNQEEQNFFRAGISYAEEILGIKTRFTPGVRISNPASLYSHLDTWKEFPVSTKFRARLFHRGFIDSLDGTGQSATLNFDYDLGRFLLFRFANEEIYRDKDNSLNVAHGPSLFYTINDYNAVSFNYRGHLINHPTYHLDYHLLSISHRHAFYKKIWYIEVVPGLSFPKENRFKGEAGLSLKLEMIFG